MTSPPIAPLPAETAQAARSVFNITNLYLAIGDQVTSLLSGIDFSGLDSASGKPVSLLVQYALVTIFQFMERLPDSQAAIALSTRNDWKYALHLPLTYPGCQPQALCEFRQQVRWDRASQAAFAEILGRLAEAGLLGSKHCPPVSASGLLVTVCNLSRLDRTVESLCQALEELAVARPEWLRTITRSHWYGRYNRRNCQRFRESSPPKLVDWANETGSDIAWLLDSLAMCDDPGLSKLPGLQQLQFVWQQQYDIPAEGGQPRWRVEGCALRHGYRNLMGA